MRHAVKADPPMPHRRSDPFPKLAPQPADGDHEIGYAKPPAATRFKPGQSGNPRGRPKGSKNKLPYLNEERLKTIVQMEAYRDIKINDGKRQVTIPMAQAVIRSLAVGAAKGQQRSQRLFTELLMVTERENHAQHSAYLDTVIEYKIGWEQELDRRKRLGIEADDPVPHPDDIVFEPKTGQIHINGPITNEQKIQWDRMRQRVIDADLEIETMQKLLKERKNQKYRHIIEQDIAFERRIRQIIVSKIGEPPAWFVAAAKRKASG